MIYNTLSRTWKALCVNIVLLLTLVGGSAPQAGQQIAFLTPADADALGLSVIRCVPELGFCVTRGAVPKEVPVEPDAPLELFAPPDPLWPQQWGTQRINAEWVWRNRTQGDASVVVAVVDTGYDNTHPDLPFLFDCIAIVADSCQDGHGHGTHVAGIIAMQPNNIGGVGVSPRVSVMSVRVLDDAGRGTVSSLAEGIVEATKAGADIIQMSLGAREDSQAVGLAVRYAWERGVAMIAAAGNWGGERCAEPARRPEVLCVGAIDAEGNAPDWSNGGVDLVAPGVEILSTLPRGRYAAWSGTSMAAPFVTGVAALLLSEAPHLTPDQLYTRLRAFAEPLPCPVERCGTGLVNAQRVFSEEVPTTPEPTPTSAPIPTSTPTPAQCTVTVNRIMPSGARDRWWWYVLVGALNWLGDERLTALVVNDPPGYWSLVAQSRLTDACRGLYYLLSALGYDASCSACALSPAREAVMLINVARAEAQLPPLAYDENLAQQAAEKARRIAETSLCQHSAEVIACGFPFSTAREAVDAWLSSPPHHDILLCESCRRVGVAYLVDDFWYHIWVGRIE